VQWLIGRLATGIGQKRRENGRFRVQCLMIATLKGCAIPREHNERGGEGSPE
jgi:hypothetical protein